MEEVGKMMTGRENDASGARGLGVLLMNMIDAEGARLTVVPETVMAGFPGLTVWLPMTKLV